MEPSPIDWEWGLAKCKTRTSSGNNDQCCLVHQENISREIVEDKARAGGWSLRSVLKRLREAEKFWLTSVSPKLSKGLLPMDGWRWPDAESAS